MTFLALLLVAIGFGDILRSLVAAAPKWPRRLLLGLTAVLTSSGLGLILQGGIGWLLLLILLMVVSLVLWWLAVPVGNSISGGAAQRGGAGSVTGEGRHAQRLGGPALLLVVVLVLVGIVLCQQVMALSVEWTRPVVHGLSVADLLLALGLVLFLMMSSNALVRGALSREKPGDSEPIILQRAPALKGGRWIGPLERISLAGLILAGAYPVAAGLMAAKGIVRFPEMQADRENGNLAEYFLVGSLVSWTLALGASAIMWWGLG